MVDSTEQNLLDQLEDARHAVAFEKKLVTTLVALLVTSGGFTIGFPIFLSVMHAEGENWGGASGFPALFSLLIFIASAVFAGAYFFEDRGDPSPPEKLRNVERKYRDYLNRKAS